MIDSSCSDVLSNKSEVVGKTEFTIYKNSKILVAVDGIPLTKYRYTTIKTEPEFKITMYEDGHIDM